MDVIEKVQAMSFDTSSYLIRKNEDKAYMDNKGLNMQMLLNAGVLAENIHIDRNDTFQENDAFFSYRRDHNCGRHMTYIMFEIKKAESLSSASFFILHNLYQM